jgi:hypothetical protein
MNSATQLNNVEGPTVGAFSKVSPKPNALHCHCEAESKSTDENHEIHSAFSNGTSCKTTSRSENIRKRSDSEHIFREKHRFPNIPGLDALSMGNRSCQNNQCFANACLPLNKARSKTAHAIMINGYPFDCTRTRVARGPKTRTVHLVRSVRNEMMKLCEANARPPHIV